METKYTHTLTYSRINTHRTDLYLHEHFHTYKARRNTTQTKQSETPTKQGEARKQQEEINQRATVTQWSRQNMGVHRHALTDRDRHTHRTTRAQQPTFPGWGAVGWGGVEFVRHSTCCPVRLPGPSCRLSGRAS